MMCMHKTRLLAVRIELLLASKIRVVDDGDFRFIH